MANGFNNGLAAVCENSMWGFIDKTGEYVIEPQYQYVTDFDNSDCAVIIKDNKWGIINSKGDIVVEPEFYSIGEFADNGLAAVYKDAGGGYINRKGKVVIGCDYEIVTMFSKNGLAAVQSNGKWGIINSKGKWVVEPSYDNVEHPKSGTDCVWINNKAVFEKKENAYIVDKSGNETKLEGIDYVSEVYDDYIVFVKNLKYGIIDWDGNIIVDAKYFYIG